MAQQRLDKIIASTGRYSRREVKTLVREGRVLVDGRIAASAEDKCDPLTARISVNGEELFYREHTYVMLHKPAGVLSATEDGRGETVLDLLAPEYRKIGLFPVGRLDKDTEGLLLFTDDGMLDVRLLRPEQHVEKEYEYRAFGLLDETAMRQLETGVLLLEGQPLSLPARAQLLAHTSIGESAPYLPERFREKYLKNPSRPVTTGKLWITEGRKHQVKLMIKAVGGHVFYLKRLAIGPVRLDEALRPGEYRPLTAEELAALMPPATSGGGTAEA